MENKQQNSAAGGNPSRGGWLFNILKGALIGTGAILPGISGGVLCVVLGIYRPIMNLLQHPLRELKSGLRFFLPILLGFAVGVIGIAVPPITGGGYGYVQFALQGGAGLAAGWLLLFSLGKILTVSLSVGSGGSGGVFGPTLYIGAMLGGAFAGLLHVFHITVDPSWLVVVGMAAVFAGAARVPIASMVMVIEMTGGFEIITPAMLTVAIAFLVQIALTRHAKHPTLYEAQVPTPADSPAFRELVYQNAVNLLRHRHVHLDPETLSWELQAALDLGEGVALRQHAEQLYSVKLMTGSPIAEQEIHSLGLPKMGILIVGLVRGGHETVPDGSTRLQVGDDLLVACSGTAIEQFRALVASPQASDQGIHADG